MGSRMKEDQHRVTALLKDTVTLLCKNGLTYKKNMKIQGLLGITLDDDEVFIVHLNESMANLDAVPDESNNQTNSDASDGRTPSKRRRRRRSSASSDNTFTTPSKRRNTNERRSNVQVKTEPETITLDEIKIHDSDSDEGGGALDDGLNFAINSISSLNDSGSSTLPQQTNKNMTSSFASPSSEQPFITGFVTNQANIPEPSQSSSNSSFAWDSSAAQGHPNMASWAGQITQQTMSQTPQSIVHSGMSQAQPDMSQAGTSQAGTSMDSSSASRHGTMPGKKQRRPRGTYSLESMRKAVEAVRSGSLSLRKASKVFGVPDSTIRDRASGRVEEGAKPGRRQVLPAEVEEELARYIKDSAATGITLSRLQIAPKVAEYIKHYKLKAPWKKVPGTEWWASFKKRNGIKFGQPKQ